MLTYPQALRSAFHTNYATFKGRATRAEYWWAALTVTILNTLLVAVKDIPIVFTGLSLLSVTTIIPMIAVSVRRLHDIGKSGIHILINIAVTVITGLTLTAYILTLITATLHHLPVNMPGHNLADKTANLLTTLAGLTATTGLPWFTYSIFILNWLIHPSQTTPNKYGQPHK
jgi:uncharacterized membrane protein YhaH (DUF805 family)